MCVKCCAFVTNSRVMVKLLLLLLLLLLSVVPSSNWTSIRKGDDGASGPEAYV